ncbi:mitogen-activated protein kinase smk1 [Zygosaccharomyces mellis]|uniref:Mitogen-activated protein kinase smk1 n=1 Tax=Zygosaccharomyces mellis TaxID=42258 RepID=A0A4C2E4F9_9SACH|nr:mitogen-activated protein kinase smk1 [Zygosaccharomyces mellis]
MDFSNIFGNNRNVLNWQQRDPKQDWKYYRYKPSSDRIKSLLTTQPDKGITKEQEVVPRTILESVKFSMPARYELIHILGKGSYGTVCSVKDKQTPGAPYSIAVKKITNIFYREILLKRAIRELKFMNYFKGHKNIVSLINLEIVTEKPYDGVYCYQELIDYDLAKVIHSSVQLSEFHVKHFFYQILCGLKYIHSADVIHRDLKPGNILCSLNGCLKICDFGLARGVAPQYFTTRESYHDITNYVATRWYRAPELILSHKSYNKAIDLWSAGCILAEFYGRKPVFMGKDSVHQIYEITKILGSPSRELLIQYGSLKAWNMCTNTTPMCKKVLWSDVYPFASSDALELISLLVQWEADQRLTVEEAIEHDFLQEVRRPEDEPVCPKGPFDFSYENQLCSMLKLREYLVNEVMEFREERAMCDPSTPEILRNIAVIEDPE